MDDKDGRLQAALQAAESERHVQDKDHRREKKIKSRNMFRRRKLDKDVRNYTNNRTRINSRDIDRIGRKHGFHIGSTPFRESPAPPEDA